MPIDTSIYGMVRQPAQQPGPLDEYAKAMTLRSMIDQQGLHSLQRRKLEQEFADDEATRAAYTQGGGDPVRVRDILAGQGLYRPAQAIEKTISDRREKDATIGKTEMETFVKGMGLLKDRLPTVRDEASYQEYRQAAASILGPQAFQRANLPPSYSPDWVQRQLVEAKQLFTPKPQEMDLGGRRVVVDMNPFTNPSIVGQSFQKGVTPDAALSAGVQVRAQDAPTLDSGSLQWITKPNAGAPIPAVGGGAPVPVAPQGAPAAPQPSVPTSPLPGANATYKGANPMKATTDAIAKIKAEMAQTRDPALRASLQREIDGAAQALRMTPEQVAAIQPATAQPSAYDTENNDARDLRLANMPNGGRPAAPAAAPAAPGGSVAIRPVGADGQPLPNPKAREDADALRKEWNALPEVKNYREVVPIINAAKTAPDTPAGDFALIYGVGKILDPGSVVREGEMNMVIKSGSPAERVKSYLTYLQGNGRITPQMRTELNQMLSGRVGEMKASFDAAKDSYMGIVTRRGHDPADVFSGVPDLKETPAKDAPAAGETRVKTLPDPAKHNGYTATDPASGITYKSDGKKWVKVNG